MTYCMRSSDKILRCLPGTDTQCWLKLLTSLCYLGLGREGGRWVDWIVVPLQPGCGAQRNNGKNYFYLEWQSGDLWVTGVTRAVHSELADLRDMRANPQPCTTLWNEHWNPLVCNGPAHLDVEEAQTITDALLIRWKPLHHQRQCLFRFEDFPLNQTLICNSAGHNEMCG